MFLIRRLPSTQIVPIMAQAVTTPASSAACGSLVDKYSVVIAPQVPLTGSAIYTVVLLSGITSGGTLDENIEAPPWPSSHRTEARAGCESSLP